MERQSGIYKIQSKIKPERIYIGSAVCIANRWKQHLNRLKAKTHDNPKLQCHYNKYGEVDFSFSILLGCDKEYLIANEQFFIDSYKPWFNICIKVVNSRLGVITSDESKQKQRIAKLGTKQSKETIEKRKISIGIPWNKGKKATPAARLNQSEAHLGQKAWNKGKKGFMAGRKLSEEAKKRIGDANRGRKLPPISEETRHKISKASKGRKLSEETKEKLRILNLGNKYALGREVSEETRKKISESNKGKKMPPLSDDVKQRIRQRMMGNQYGVGNKNAFGYRFSDEAKQKMRERLLKEWALKKLKNRIDKEEVSLCN